MNIRNFVIIAHIDHGKSTLADRFLELTGTVEKRKMRDQFLDQMDLERERGITIKLQPVRMEYSPKFLIYPQGDNFSPYGGSPEGRQFLNKPQNSNDQISKNAPQSGAGLEIRNSDLEISDSKYILNLIDTPGHVDFSYEVSRSLAAVEGAILLVDATKGVQAQTLANLHLAQEQGLAIIPAINKIDLPGARVEEAEKEIRGILGEGKIFPGPSLSKRGGEEEIYRISAKEGLGVEELLQAVIAQTPPPSSESNKPLRALVFDSNYDSYKGVLAYVRVADGAIKRGDKILMMASGAKAEVVEVGIFKPSLEPAQSLSAGEIGYIATGLKDVSLCRVGDTVTNLSVYQFVSSSVLPLPGYREPKPMIFASFYPAPQLRGEQFDLLKEALAKLRLSDASLVFEPEFSEALGRGFKCGFLGMLHMEIVTERLRREHNIHLVVTTPSVIYHLREKGDKEERIIYSSHELPDPSKIEEIQEPWIKLDILAPVAYLGAVMKLTQSLDGSYLNTQYLSGERIIVSYEAPLREIIVDFYDRLKSGTSGYASMSYELIGFRRGDLVCLDILVAGEKIEAFSRIVPRHKTYQEGKALVEKLKEVLPPQLFSVSLQAAVGGKILAREDIRARRKDVTGYLYGGDVTRKRKLLEKQKRGKEKMREAGRVNIPQDVFLKVLKK